MTKKKVENQNVEEKQGVAEEAATNNAENDASANVAEETEASADTVAEEPKAEEVDWRDKYLR